jgi:hypothetical protein
VSLEPAVSVVREDGFAAAYIQVQIPVVIEIGEYGGEVAAVDLLLEEDVLQTVGRLEAIAAELTANR